MVAVVTIKREKRERVWCVVAKECGMLLLWVYETFCSWKWDRTELPYWGMAWTVNFST